MNNPNWPCKCSHQLDEHEVLSNGLYFNWKSINPDQIREIKNCTIVTVSWTQGKIVHCVCKDYDPITNLEYLEKEYESTVSL